MQIRLLNELREKDTKQHIKSITEMDALLKKKSTDAEKVTHLLDQLRVKQERIQELETNYARIEKQSNQERQTYEKQAHENWLHSKKIEKELKETRAEMEKLKETLSKKSQISPVVHSDSEGVQSQHTEQLHIETNVPFTNQNHPEPPRPSSFPHIMSGPSQSFGFMRPPPPFKYPFPMMLPQQSSTDPMNPSTNSTPEAVTPPTQSPMQPPQLQPPRFQPPPFPQLMYRMNPMMMHQQQYLQQLHHQHQQQQLNPSSMSSNNSSQQPSPGASFINNPPEPYNSINGKNLIFN